MSQVGTHRASDVLRASSESVTLACPGQGTVGIQLAGTWVATLVFEVSLTKDTWVALNVTAPNSTSTVTGATANGLWSGSVAGFEAVRVRCSAFTSGEIGVLLQAVSVGGGGGAAGGGGGGGGTSSAFGSAFPGDGTAAGFKSSDGTTMQAGNLDASGNLKVTSAATTASTSTLTNVADNAASVTLLASNSSRLAFEIYNDSSAILYLKFGATASTTSFTKKMLPGDLFNTAMVGANYTGLIAGIWASAPGGAARCTELTA